MTAMDIHEFHNDFSELGGHSHFPKPITTTDLCRALEIVYVDKGAEIKDQKEISSTHIEWPDGTRLLLVEDNPINQLVAKEVLTAYGLSIDIAENGLAALQCLERSSDHDSYTLILMDCQMPEMDGYDASKEIRKGKVGEKYRNIPIIALTANAMLGDREKCLDAGMCDYITKPIEEKVLINKLKLWLLNSDTIEKSNNQHSQDFNQIATSKNSLGSKSGSSAMIWDIESALQRVNGDNILLNKLINLFFRENSKRMEQLKQAIHLSDAEQVRHTAHTFKGVAGNLSGKYFEYLAEKIELAAKEGDLPRVMEMLPEFKKSNEDLKRCFEAFQEAG